jgi:ribosomal protein S18 acetylase RimI-like enzyme
MPPFEIVDASGPEWTPTARALFEEYQRSLGIDLCFQGFDRELAELPGAYAPPAGRLLAAFVGGEPAGCVALRPLAGGDCELKRLYVRPAHRGVGLGRALTETIVATARELGYRRVLLDTLPSMAEAQALYRSLGFGPAETYTENPVPGATFMALDLEGKSGIGSTEPPGRRRLAGAGPESAGAGFAGAGADTAGEVPALPAPERKT